MRCEDSSQNARSKNWERRKTSTPDHIVYSWRGGKDHIVYCTSMLLKLRPVGASQAKALTFPHPIFLLPLAIYLFTNTSMRPGHVSSFIVLACSRSGTRYAVWVDDRQEREKGAACHPSGSWLIHWLWIIYLCLVNEPLIELVTDYIICRHGPGGRS